LLLVAALSAALLAGCSDEAGGEADGRYIGDLDARSVPTGPTNGTNGAELGHAVCTDLDDGADAGAKVMQVAGLQLNHMPQFTTRQAEIIVYWAVSDLCPAHAAGLREEWRDGA